MQRVASADRLVLGTAQLGLDYGVANATGKPAEADAFGLLDVVWQAGLRWFDTAPVYGNSEKVLGRYLAERDAGNEANVVSKLSGDVAKDSLEILAEESRDSLERIQVKSLAGLMLHNQELLESWQDISPRLEGLKGEGLIRKTGISVYSPQKAIEALKTPGVDIIQVPANVFDHRFRKAGVFDLAGELGKEVFIRSVFLQGLFFATAEDFSHREERLQFLDRDRALMWIGRLNDLAQEISIPLDHLALAYVRDAYPDARILIGMETAEQARRNLEAWEAPLPSGLTETVEKCFADVEEQIVHPPYWRRGSLA